MRALLLGFLAAALLPGADLSVSPTIAARIDLGEKWDLLLRARGRVVASENYWYDVSAGPMVRYRPHSRVRISIGVYLSGIQVPELGWKRLIRPFAAVEPALFRREGFTIATRSRFERFLISEPVGDFNRFRQRLSFHATGKLSPFVYIEPFFRSDGLSKTRYGAGVRKRLPRKMGIELGYFYEAEDFAGAGFRHMIVTILELNSADLTPKL